MIKEAGKHDIGQTVQTIQKPSLTETVKTEEQCTNLADVFHMGGAVQGVGETITLSSYERHEQTE